MSSTIPRSYIASTHRHVAQYDALHLLLYSVLFLLVLIQCQSPFLEYYVIIMYGTDNKSIVTQFIMFVQVL